MICNGKTYSDGGFYFFPGQYDPKFKEYNFQMNYSGLKVTGTIHRFGKRTLTIPFQVERLIPNNVPLDILFIFDTTGSMKEEIDRLKKTIELIYLNLSALSTKPFYY